MRRSMGESSESGFDEAGTGRLGLAVVPLDLDHDSMCPDLQPVKKSVYQNRKLTVFGSSPDVSWPVFVFL